MDSATDYDSIIDALSTATERSWRLDLEIARLMGWTVAINTKVSSENGAPLRIWTNPATGKEGRPPRCTANLQAARDLVEQVAPARAAALAWGPDGCRAQIEGNEPVFAKTPQIALSLAAIHELKRQYSVDDD